MEQIEEVRFLNSLTKREIERISKLPQPVIRVCGPLTCDGSEGYDKNAKRLLEAGQVLEGRGKSVWFPHESELEIREQNCSHSNVCYYFHKPILESGLIKEAYFLPRWKESKGSVFERNLAEQTGVVVREFPNEWFNRE